MRKCILVIIIFLNCNSFAFRLSRLLNKAGEDSTPKALVKWENHSVSMGVSIESDSNYPTSNYFCPNISSNETLIKNVIQKVNDIREADINLNWDGNSGEHDITIYSYTSSEWDTYASYMQSKGQDVNSSVLGRASLSARCNSTECNFTTTTIRINCAKLGNPPTGSTSDYEAVLLHETIHTLGLDHSSEPETVMYPYISSNTTEKRTVTMDDEAGIIFIYPKDSAPSVLKYIVCGRIDPSHKFPWHHKLKHLFFLTLFFLLLIYLKQRKKASLVNSRP